MARFKLYWRWSAVNLFAVFTFVIVLTRGSTDWNRTDTFDPGLESGKWAIRFLLTCLAMTPLNTYFGWRSAIKLRKSAGLWAFGFACLHVLLYIREAKLEWLTLSMPSYFAFGLAGLATLTTLAVTSNRWCMQRFGKNWKRLHRLVYLSGIVVITHSLLALNMSKKLHVRDPQAEYELKAYAAVLFALLVVRIPLVRRALRQIPILWMHRRKSIPVLARHDNDRELWPGIHGRESGASVRPTFIIPNETPTPSEPVRLGVTSGRIIKVCDGGLESPFIEIPPEVENEIQETA